MAGGRMEEGKGEKDKNKNEIETEKGRHRMEQRLFFLRIGRIGFD
jgi:hypothetical protein